MKCTLCKYKNSALEAEKHPNGTTVFSAEALKKRLDRMRVCSAHGDSYGTDVEAANKALVKAKEYGYVPLDLVWHTIVWMPRGDRL